MTDWWEAQTEYDLHRWQDDYDFDSAWERYRKRKEGKHGFLGKHDGDCNSSNDGTGFFTDVH